MQFEASPLGALTTMAYLVYWVRDKVGERVTCRHSLPLTYSGRLFPLVVPEVRSEPVGRPLPSVALIDTVTVPGVAPFHLLRYIFTEVAWWFDWAVKVCAYHTVPWGYSTPDVPEWLSYFWSAACTGLAGTRAAP